MKNHQLELPSTNLIKARYADHIEGYYLRTIDTVGIPYNSFSVVALVRKAPDIPPLDEAILGLIAEDIDREAELIQLLGISARLFRTRVVELVRRDFVIVMSDNQSEFYRLSIKGDDYVKKISRMEVSEQTIPDLHFNGITRDVELIAHRPSFMMPFKYAKQYGVENFIKPYPKKRPTSEDITPLAVANLIRKSSRKSGSESQQQIELMAIKAVDQKSVRTIYRPCQLLTFSPLRGSGREIHVFLRDGEPWEELTKAFGQSNGVARHDWLIPDSSITELKIKSSVIQEAATASKVDAAREAEIESTQREIAAITKREYGEDRPDTRDLLRSEISKLQEKLERLHREKEQAQKPASTFLDTREIKHHLDQALKTSSDRLLIVSGFLSIAVVNDQFASKLEQLLRNGVQVYLAYGMKDRKGEQQRNQFKWKDAELRLNRLKSAFPKHMHINNQCDTHAKILISDSSFAICGSFNFLSFPGVPKGREPLRDERALKIISKSEIDGFFIREKNSYFKSK